LFDEEEDEEAEEAADDGGVIDGLFSCFFRAEEEDEVELFSVPSKHS
jgi:hypothetical protein